MPVNRADIIHRLQKDILSLQGIKSFAANEVPDFGLGPVESAFPNNCFPVAATHEFLSDGPEHAAAATGFIACLTSTLMRKGGASVWISSGGSIFPPALKSFGIEPDKIIFIDLKNEKDSLWVMEEVLKCNGIAAVIGEIRDLDFTASRRFQLAVEQSGVTGFIIRNNPRYITINACVSRWRISPLASEPENGVPGVGFPRWNVELSKIRNGKPGAWQIEWSAGCFHIITPSLQFREKQRKVV